LIWNGMLWYETKCDLQKVRMEWNYILRAQKINTKHKKQKNKKNKKTKKTKKIFIVTTPSRVINEEFVCGEERPPDIKSFLPSDFECSSIDVQKAIIKWMYVQKDTTKIGNFGKLA